MNDDALRQRFHDRIAPRLDQLGHVAKRPQLLMVGGQPGAGKTRALSHLVVHSTTPLYSVVGDDLRQHHPDYDRLVHEDPMGMPDATADASSTWIRMSLAYAKERGISVAVEGTFRDPAVSLRTAEQFARAGYEVQVAALGVPSWQSRLSTVARFVEDHSVGRSARWTPLSAHDEGYAGTPVTFQRLGHSPAVRKLLVVDREGLLFEGSEVPLALDALTAARRRTPTPVEARAWLSDHDRCLTHLAASFPEHGKEVAAALDADRSRILMAQAYPPGAGGRRSPVRLSPDPTTRPTRRPEPPTPRR